MDFTFGAIALGLLSAGSYGASDFLGGVISKRNATYTVVFTSQIFGTLAYVLLAILTNDPFPEPRDLAVGALAGVAGVIGINALYRGLAQQAMSLVAPVSAVIAAVIPVLYSIATEGPPESLTLLGFVIALAAVWLVSGGASARGIRWDDLRLPVLSGICFGVLFILISDATRVSTYYPLLALRGVSLPITFLAAALSRQPYLVPRRYLPLTILTGLGDAGGNVFFALAAQAGRLDVASVMAALYPAGTVLLAAIFLREQVARAQRVGILLALAAIVMITI
jgi:drug/metabolite transporter (DMT)-like permease